MPKMHPVGRACGRIGLVTTLLLVACGGSSSAPVPTSSSGSIKPNATPGPAPTYSCAPGGARPPEKLLLAKQGGIAGEYVVVLLDEVADIAGTARRLGTKYGGEILAIYTAAIRGFAARIDDSRARSLSDEPEVCWVEQSKRAGIP